MQRNDCLVVKEFGAAFGTKIVLADVEFVLEQNSITVLMGPSGSGKSTVLHSLAGTYLDHPRYRSWGQALYQERPISKDNHPPLVQQHVRILSGTVQDALVELVRAQLSLSPLALREWCVAYLRDAGFPDLESLLDHPFTDLSDVQMRAVAILREAAVAPSVLLVDEPTADLDDYDAFLLVDLMRQLGRRMSLLVVTHNQKQARQLAQRVILLAGGRVQEERAVEDFFNAPLSEAGLQFIRTGSCSVAALDADPSTLAEGVPAPAPLPAEALTAAASGQEPQAAPLMSTAVLPGGMPTLNEPHAAQGAVAASSGGPTGFLWIVPGKLAGAAMPGAVDDIHHDLALLKRVGVTTLITLTERDIDQAALAQHGLKNVHLPVYDREAPSLGQIQMLLKRMESLMSRGDVLAVHCLGGLGRTGTVLTAWLIREGLTAQEALRRVRLLDPRYVQSAEQEVFLHEYEELILQKII
ncbi:ATP-binding cassette domain-containing protein [Diaphorobacter ruginosibacter]|uniref:ATP-binding cassette domain-containing protein n=1 Tax=Diaphorobacter ruginosibacter TaxID=1715720 RepID=A0A7G9RM04_9BURK|nr:ATP-binding cassette domain-containing protein [Diaphorobacter ruginosibacter]QNN56629.1 ATP-binding cassette domain-containing protein [Diaphorobacter ruginosibacter]